MKKKISSLILTMCIVGLNTVLNGCYTYKPIGSLSKMDANTRVNVKDAGYVKRKNALGFTLNVGIVGLGAAGGYALEPFSYQSGELKKPNNLLNAGLGALIGAGAVLITDIFSAHNKVIFAPDPQKWIKHVNRDYQYVSGGNNDFKMINPNIENGFQVETKQDAVDFKHAFPNSIRENEIFLQALQKVSRKDLPELIEVYKGNANLDRAKEMYIKNSVTIDDLMAAKQKYPTIDYDYEAKALTLVNGVDESKSFFEYFPNSSHSSDVFKIGLEYVDDKDIPNYLLFASPNVNTEIINKTKQKYIWSQTTLEQACKAYAPYSSCMDESTFMKELVNRQYIKTLSDFMTLKAHMGYVEDATEYAVINVAQNVTSDKYRELLDSLPQLRPRERKYLEERLNVGLQAAYQAARGNISKLSDFLKLYPKEQSPFIDKARYELSYLKLRIGDGSIFDYAFFAKQYPQHSAEMEELAFEQAYSTKRMQVLDDFLKCFPNSVHKSAIKERIPIVQGFEIELANQKCDRCNGTGNCYQCRASGFVICSNCKGSGMDWSGTEYCYKCKGKRETVCNICNGKKRCPSCYGTGKPN